MPTRHIASFDEYISRGPVESALRRGGWGLVRLSRSTHQRWRGPLPDGTMKTATLVVHGRRVLHSRELRVILHTAEKTQETPAVYPSVRSSQGSTARTG